MFGIRFIKAEPTDYVIQYKRGKTLQQGAGLAFFYFAPTTSLALIPVSSIDVPFIFEEVTADFQQITVQGQVTYRVSDAPRLARLMNYTVAPGGQTYVSEDPQKLPQRLINHVQVLTRSSLKGLTLRDALGKSENLVTALRTNLQNAESVTALGIEVLGLSILAIKPTPETARALEADAREQILKQADEAIYARRNAAIEQERAIKENELNTEIAVENKKRQIKETQMEAEKSVQQKKNELRQAEMTARIALEQQNKALVALATVNAREEADTKAYAVAALMKAASQADPKILQALTNSRMEPGQLLALAFRDIADSAGKIGQLNISPDLLREIMNQPAPKIMERLTDNKIILVVRHTRLDELLKRFNTESQARFYVEHLGADFSDYQQEDRTYKQAVQDADHLLARIGRVQVLDRSYVPNFIFGPADLVIALGQDGLAANVLKYLNNQLLLGVNPDPGRWEGILVPFKVAELPAIVPQVFEGKRPARNVSIALAHLNTGETLYGVNDLFIGPRTHTSARYTITIAGRTEAHSSSGIIVSTGLGSTGWLRSIVAGATGIASAVSGRAPAPLREQAFAWDADYLYFSVREPWPSKTSGAQIVFGQVKPDSPLTLVSHMAENGVIFSDGIEADFLHFDSGTTATITLAGRKGRLVV